MARPDLAAHELQRIGVLLLRHHAAAGAERVGQLEEAVLVAAQDDQVLRQPAQMHHRHRAGVEERRGEIAIGRRVHAVVDDAREAEVAGERVDVDGVARCRRSRRCRAAARRLRRARRASRAKSRRSGAACDEEEMRDQHRLRRAEVRERRHQRVAGRRRLRRRARRRRRATARCSSGMRRRRYSRRSSETCSLRERPVCSRRPASPSRSTSSRSTKLWTSSSSPDDERRDRRGRARASPSAPPRSGAPRRRPARRRFASARAHAMLPVTSSSNRRRSKRNEAPNSNAAASGAASKRPDQRVSHQSCSVDPVVSRRRESSRRFRADDAFSATWRPGRRRRAQSPLNSFRRTTPVTRCCTVSTTASSASRAA